MSRQQALNWIDNNTLTGIRAGTDRERFLDIWMVSVDGRIFARSWGLSERSWYTAFHQDPIGAIRCGEQVFAVRAHIPEDLEALTPRINQAYLDKYTSEHNRPYAEGIVRKEHAAHTMELLLV